jgi:tryptophan 2,3-dioxygenase
MKSESISVELDYTTYLRLPELLTAQSPRSEPENPDELHFIVTHQAIELWFKALVADVRRARDLIDGEELIEAVAVIRRARAMVDVTVAQLSTLEFLPPEAFHQFRHHLGTASGLESVQFRELEILSGLRSPQYQSRLRSIYGRALPDSLERALVERNLADAHQDAGARRGVVEWAEFYADPLRDKVLYQLTSALVDYDDAWRRWRSEHVALVLRMLGGAALGTAGSDSSYLTRRLYCRFFPYLWEARSDFTLRAGGQLASGGVATEGRVTHRGDGPCVSGR